MNAIDCIKTVNKDIVNGVKDFFIGIPNVITMKFWNDNAEGFILLGALVAIIATTIGALVLGMYFTEWYLPNNATAYQWVPIIFLWGYFFIMAYVIALFNKCREQQ